jgi:cell division inhibitor SepF
VHEFRSYVEQEMASRGMDRSELRRRSGLSRQQIHRLLTDERPRLPERPTDQTIDGLASAFGPGSRRSLMSSVLQAMGLPTDDALDVALSDEELVRELASRLRARGGPAATGRTIRLAPASYAEVTNVGDEFRAGHDVRLDLSGVDDADAKRIVDFIAGIAFALHGRLTRIEPKVLTLGHNSLVGSGPAEEERGALSVVAYEPADEPADEDSSRRAARTVGQNLPENNPLG